MILKEVDQKDWKHWLFVAKDSFLIDDNKRTACKRISRDNRLMVGFMVGEASLEKRCSCAHGPQIGLMSTEKAIFARSRSSDRAYED